MCRYMDEHPEIGVLGPKVLNRDGVCNPPAGSSQLLKNLCGAMALDKLFQNQKYLADILWWTGRMTLFSKWIFKRMFYDGKEKAQSNRLVTFRWYFFLFTGKTRIGVKDFGKAGWKVVYFLMRKPFIIYTAVLIKDPWSFTSSETRANLQYYSKHHSRAAKERLSSSNKYFSSDNQNYGFPSILYILKPSGKEITLQNQKKPGMSSLDHEPIRIDHIGGDSSGIIKQQTFGYQYGQSYFRGSLCSDHPRPQRKKIILNLHNSIGYCSNFIAKRWIIVSDGSTDRTDDIVKKYLIIRGSSSSECQNIATGSLPLKSTLSVGYEIIKKKNMTSSATLTRITTKKMHRFSVTKFWPSLLVWWAFLCVGVRMITGL